MSVENPPLFYTDDEHQPDPILHTAITLWDIYFGMAMHAIMSRLELSEQDPDGIARCATHQADAMLAERAKREE